MEGGGGIVRPVGQMMSRLGQGGESLLRRVNPLSLLPGHEQGGRKREGGVEKGGSGG